MSDFKSKLPNFKELGDITGKLFKDIKNSVSEIISDYKQKHAEADELAKNDATAPTVKTEVKVKKTATTTTETGLPLAEAPEPKEPETKDNKE